MKTMKGIRSGEEPRRIRKNNPTSQKSQELQKKEREGNGEGKQRIIEH